MRRAKLRNVASPRRWPDKQLNHAILRLPEERPMCRRDIIKLIAALTLGALLANAHVLWGAIANPPASVSVSDDINQRGQ